MSFYLSQKDLPLISQNIFQLPELAQFSVGLMHIQLLHTSASLAINENWDPDVRDDMEMMLNRNVTDYNALIRLNNVCNVQAGARVYSVEAQLRGP